MFQITVTGAEDFNKRIDGMIGKIDHFSKVELGQVMSSWQTTDLNRHRAFTMRWRGRLRKAVTVVRPHSLREMLGLREYSRQLRRGLHIKARVRRRKPLRVYHKWSTRPILRAAMWDQLVDLMLEAFHNGLRW